MDESTLGFLRQLIDINPHFIFVKDRAGRFTLVNEAVAAAYGTTPEDLVGRTDADFNPNEEEVAHFLRDDIAVMDAGIEKFIPEEVITDASGSVRYLQTIKRPIVDADGVARHVLGVSTDITELKRAHEQSRELEARMLHAQKLESLGVMAGGIAHDFNNLLVGLIAHTELALRRVQDQPDVSRNLERARGSAYKARDLCQQMLSYAGRRALEMRPIELSAVVSDMLELLGSVTKGHVELGLELQPRVLVDADRSQLEQIVLNLVTNAVEASTSGEPVVSVRTFVREFSAEELVHDRIQRQLPAGSYAAIEVQDHGEGLPPEQIKRIFDPFYSTRRSGRGLGLAVVHGHRARTPGCDPRQQRSTTRDHGHPGPASVHGSGRHAGGRTQRSDSGASRGAGR